MTDITNANDLRTAYLQTFDSFSLTPGDIVESSEGRVNMRYARELLGTLVTANLLTVQDVNGEEEVWQVSNPGTYDNSTREEAEAVIDGWLSTVNPTEKASKPSKPAKDKKMTKTETSVHPCYCGCKEDVPAKSFYRPGHDARHAGVVGRLAATKDDPMDSDHYSDLPSERLVEKAKGIAAKAVEKADAKAKREQEKAETRANVVAKGEKAKPEEGTVKVGKNEFAATRYPDGTVKYFKGEDEKVASKAASATFTTE